MDPADLDALDQALATVSRYEPDGHRAQWRSFFRADLAAAVDAILRAAPALLAELRRLRADLAASRLASPSPEAAWEAVTRLTDNAIAFGVGFDDPAVRDAVKRDLDDSRAAVLALFGVRS